MEGDSTCPVLSHSARLSLSILLSDWLLTVCRGFLPLLPLTTESRRSSNAQRMTISLSKYLNQQSWAGTRMIRQNCLHCASEHLTDTAHSQQRAQEKRWHKVKIEKNKWKEKGCGMLMSPFLQCLGPMLPFTSDVEPEATLWYQTQKREGVEAPA